MYNYYRKDHVLIGNTSRVKLPKRVAVWTYNDSNYNMISFRTSTNYKVGNRPVTVRMAVNNNAVEMNIHINDSIGRFLTFVKTDYPNSNRVLTHYKESESNSHGQTHVVLFDNKGRMEVHNAFMDDGFVLTKTDTKEYSRDLLNQPRVKNLVDFVMGEMKKRVPKIYTILEDYPFFKEFMDMINSGEYDSKSFMSQIFSGIGFEEWDTLKEKEKPKVPRKDDIHG